MTFTIPNTMMDKLKRIQLDKNQPSITKALLKLIDEEDLRIKNKN